MEGAESGRGQAAWLVWRSSVAHVWSPGGRAAVGMSSDCESYYSRERVLVESFTCPRTGGDPTAVFCCGFSDLKFCCDDPHSFFPHEYAYMWRLR